MSRVHAAGMMALTVMPLRRPSPASDFVRPIIDAFADEYAAVPGAPKLALDEVMITRPAPLDTRWGHAARVTAMLPDVKVLFTSGYTSDIMIYQGPAGTGLAFLQKPFTPVTLARKVREVLDS